MSSQRVPPDYRAVFEALPLPATLVDPDGLIVDLNQASVALAHRLGRQVGKQDRIGHRLASFASTQEAQRLTDELVAEALTQGRAEQPPWEARDAAGARLWLAHHAAAVRDGDGRPTGVVLLRSDTTQRVRQDQLRDSQERLRDALWRMSGPSQLAELLGVLHWEILALLPQTAACSVQLRDPEAQRWVSYHLDREAAHLVQVSPTSDGAVMTCWLEQRPVYRSDLAALDTYAEAHVIWHGEYGYTAEVRSVLDVPFAQGTLAVNSHRPDAYSREDVRILQDLAQVLAVGFARLADLQHLAQRTGQLEREVAQREAAEQILRHDLQREEAMGRIRDHILGLRDPSALHLLLQEEWLEELRRLGVPAYRVSVETRSLRQGYCTVAVGAAAPQSGPATGEICLAQCPWVGEAWQSGRPVTVDHERLVEVGFADSEVLSLIELPLAGGEGSLGVSSTVAQAFAPGAVRTLQVFAGLVALALRRLQDMEALRQARDKLDATLGALPDLLLEVDGTGRIHDCRAPESVGLHEPAAALLGHTLAEVLPPETAAAAMAAIEEAAARGGSFGRSCRLPLPAGPRWLELSVALQRGAVLAGQRLVVLARDITDRRRAEQATRVDLALQRVRDAILQMESEEDWYGVARTLDQEMRALLPYDGCGINIIDPVRSCYRAYVVDPDAVYAGYEVDHLPRSLAQVLDSGKPLYRGSRAELVDAGDGDIGLEVNSVVDVPFVGGTLALNSRAENAFGAWDIEMLERFARVMSEALRRWEDVKLIEAQRRQAEGRLRLDLALEQVRTAVLQMGAEEDWEKVEEAMDSALRLLLPFHQSTVIVLDLHRSGPEAYWVKRRGVLWEIHEPDTTMLATALGRGRTVYRANRADPLFNPDIPPEVHSVVDVPFLSGTLGVSRTEEDAFSEEDIRLLEQFAPVLSLGARRLQDIAERARIEQDLVRVQRLHAAAELSAGVSHNLNNILTGVLLPAQMLQRMTDDRAMRRMIDTILSSAERAAELVHRLHQSVGRHQGADMQAVFLDRAIQQVVDATRPRWKDAAEAQGRTIEVCVDLAPTPPIRGTESDLHALLTNLMLNAVDAMPGGGTITIRTRSADGCVRLDFGDTGTGMDEATRLRVFEPFFTTKADIGTGLGLSTLHSAVSQWGGTVTVESAPGQGATFTLELPLWCEAVPAAVAARAAQSSRPGRIVIIDDNEPVARSLARALGVRHQVDCCLEPDRALAQFAAARYDVAIIDLGIPGVPGDQLARRLQELDPAAVRVLFTGWELAADDPRRQPFDLQLAKPVPDLDQLDALISQAILLHDQRAGAAG